ncbi:hypothetical protein H4W33_005930 [Kibdelosporangium phytohabitans]|nr:hypothetical protein [Kibdelosporangium phytohabitans]
MSLSRVIAAFEGVKYPSWGILGQLGVSASGLLSFTRMAEGCDAA